MAVMRLGLVGFFASAALLVACGSGNGFDDDASQTGDGGQTDAGEQDVTVDVSQNKDSSSPNDSSPPPTNDATLDVNFGDAIWTADSNGGGGNDAAQDTGTGCAPDGILCNGNVAEKCLNGQLSTQTCPNVCADGYGCVTCVPGSGSCNGSTGTLCNSTGTGYVTNNCDPNLGLTCQGGVCTGDCASIGQSYIGCEYYAITSLNNELDQGVFFPAVSLSNTSTKPAKVYISGPHAVSGSPFTIAAGAIQTIQLPWESAISCGTGPCDGTAPTPPTTLRDNGGAYHIESNEPITAYQFNARDYQVNSTCSSGNSNGGLGSPPCYSFTNDASLLIPVNAMTGNYYVATFPSWLTEPGLIDIVGTQSGTSVTVSPSVKIDSGGGLSTTGGTVTLNAGDVLQITTPTPGVTSTCGTCNLFGCNMSGCKFGNDMSGTAITASAPVEVFGGHACTFNPANQYACDHLEEVNLPTETLGSDYLVIPPDVNSTYIKCNFTGCLSKPTHTVKIIGTKASTTLTYDPSPNVISGSASGSVGAGGVVTFETDTPFHLTATNPVAVSTIMMGGNSYNSSTTAPTTEYIGDPAQSIAVPTGQFRNSYAFTAPSSYYVNYVTLIAKANNSVTVDTTTVAAGSFTAIGSSGYGFYYYKICDGAGTTCQSVSANHTTSSAAGFGIQVYGYGSYTSYWYPGGLNLTR